MVKKIITVIVFFPLFLFSQTYYNSPIDTNTVIATKFDLTTFSPSIDSTLYVTKTNLDSVKDNRAYKSQLTSKISYSDTTNLIATKNDLIIIKSLLKIDLEIPILAATIWTNMPLAESFWLSTATVAKNVTKADLTNYTQVRLLVNKQATAGATTSKLILKYKTTPFTQTVANYSNIGTSEVSVVINVQNTFLETSWINIASGAKADVFIALTGINGDGVLDPAFGTVVAEFK